LRRSMWEFVQRLNAEGTTIVLTTHYLEEAERLCKRVVIFKAGEVATKGEIASLVKDSGAKNLEEFYLGL